ncbi:MAG: exodeoxyribonuclease VII large subunit [Rhodospirillales bacterium]|nr:exodeoxyribonuclease VII large subunit [Rhodospirillales bacterium]
MVDHPSTANDEHNVPVFTVGQISSAIRRQIETSFERVRVKGEVSGLRKMASGHLYFSLKDESAVLKGVCWRQAAMRLRIEPEDGLEVIVDGRLTTYGGRSEYQIIADSMQFAGAGALLQLLEDRKRKWAAEGLFAPERKQLVPFLPDVVGIVTSPTGAALRDILHRLGARSPCRVLVWPAAVQGDGAAAQVAAGIAGLNTLSRGGAIPRPDVVIVARGGGSVEDLWPFNEEAVVRAAAACDIPLISAVGHETDTTLLDYAADLRAPTPTAAAELAVPVRLELSTQLTTLETRLVRAVRRLIGNHQVNVEGFGRGLPRPAQLVQETQQRLDDWSDRLFKCALVGVHRRRLVVEGQAGRLVDPRKLIVHNQERVASAARALLVSMSAFLQRHGDRLQHVNALLSSLSYMRTLERGFALVYDVNAHTVSSAQQLQQSMPLMLKFKDGERNVIVTNRRSGLRVSQVQGKPSGSQGTLL